MREKLKKKIIEGVLFITIHNKFNNFYLRFIKVLDKKIAFVGRKLLAKNTKVDSNSIMLITFQGDYTCNPKAIAKELIKRNLNYEIIWVKKNFQSNSNYPSELTLVNSGSYEFYKAAAKAKVLVDNTHDLPRLGIHKKNSQYLLQTWHGSLGIKRLDGNIVRNKTWKKLAAVCSSETDFCISNSTFETDVFHSSYWKNVPVLSYGHARNDILFSSQQRLAKIKEKVYKTFNLNDNVKLFLYAPTHRDNQSESMYPIDYSGLQNSLEAKFGGKWVIAIRFHSRLKKLSKEWVKSLPNIIIDATSYPDIQNLMIASDAGLTDYSSWVFDYILLKRPTFIIANDLESFETNRSFYYPLDSTPFPVASTNEQLLQNINAFDNDVYLKDINRFLDERGCFEDGHASERIADMIVSLCKKEI